MSDTKISEAAHKLAYETGMYYSQNEKCQPGIPFYAFTQGELDRFVEKLAHLQGEAVPVAWQSMATCPRDGSVVLLRWGEDHVSPGWWSAPVSPVQNDDGTWPSDSGGFPWAFFDTDNGRHFVNHAVDTKYGPTHWTPYTRPQPAELAEQQEVELPPLPPVDGYDKRVHGHYSAEQMRDYARNAIRSAKQEQACSGLGIDKMAKELLERHTVAVPVAVEDGRCFMVREQDALDAIRAALAATGKQQVVKKEHWLDRMAAIEGRIEPSAREMEGMDEEQVGEVQGDALTALVVMWRARQEEYDNQQSAESKKGYEVDWTPDAKARSFESAADELEAALAARPPGVLIAQKVGDYRVTVAEDTITVSHGRDIVFAYSAGDAEPVIARQPGAQVPVEMSPEFTDTARAAIAWVLWHHQGGSSPIGQPLRHALGMGSDQRLTQAQIEEAKRFALWAGATTNDFHRHKPAQGIDLGQQQDAERYRWLRDHYDPSVHDDEDGSFLRLAGEELDAAIDGQRDAAPGVGNG